VEAWEWRFVAVSWTAALVWSALAVLVAASADVFVQFLAIGALERFMSTAVARHNAVPRAALGQIYIVTAAVCAAVVARWDASYGVIGALALVQLFAMHRRVAALHQRALQSFRMQEKAELQATQIERMSAKLSQILTVDTLTKLMNRRGFEATLRKEWSRGISEQVPLSLMMIAIDDFRAYVAGAGMAAGEDALQRVADAVLIELRCPRDVVGRIGNAEIAVLLPQTDMLGTKATAQRILTAIAALGLSASPDGQSALTVSVGGATVVPNSEKLPALLLENADSALNRARSGGPASISIWGLGSETDDERMALASEGPAQPKPTIASLFLGEKAPRQPNPGAPPPRQPAAVADPPRVQPAMNRAL
jgi:diguanylate cyclase (GGDEF)-like protein